MSDQDSQQVRELLGEAVADVQPRRGIDAIAARTTNSRRRTWVWGSAGAVVATAATIAAVAIVTDLPGGAGPRPVPDAVDRPPEFVSVYFVGDTGAGPRLFAERREFGGRDDALVWSLANVVEGNALDPDYTSHWPSTTRVSEARKSGEALTVDLSGPVERPSTMSGDAAEIAVQQVVRTAQSVTATRLPVRFLVDGSRTATVLGVPTDEAVQRAADDDTLSPVSITTPSDGSVQTSPFTVTGRASAFEANVQWELKQGDTVVKHGFTTARECCTLSPYHFEVKAPPGTYTLVVHDEDASGGEGTPPSMDTKVVPVGG